MEEEPEWEDGDYAMAQSLQEALNRVEAQSQPLAPARMPVASQAVRDGSSGSLPYDDLVSSLRNTARARVNDNRRDRDKGPAHF